MNKIILCGCYGLIAALIFIPLNLNPLHGFAVGFLLFIMVQIFKSESVEVDVSKKKSDVQSDAKLDVNSPEGKVDKSNEKEIGYIAAIFFSMAALGLLGKLNEKIKEQGFYEGFIKNPIIMGAAVIAALILILSNKDRLIDCGFGFVYRATKFILIFVVAIIAINFITSLTGISVNSLPDNIRM